MKTNETEKFEVQEIGPSDIYNRVQDVVRDAPKVTFDNVIDYIAYDFGIKPEEVEKMCPLIRKVYEEEKENMEISRRTRLRFLGK